MGVSMIKNQKIQYFATLAGLLAVACLFTGCGVKPRAVDPPASVTHDTFPQTYPPGDKTAHPPGRYLPPDYAPQTPQKETEQPEIEGPFVP